MSNEKIDPGSLNELRNLQIEHVEAQAVLDCIGANLKLRVIRALHSVGKKLETDTICLDCGSVFNKPNNCPICSIK